MMSARCFSFHLQPFATALICGNFSCHSPGSWLVSSQRMGLTPVEAVTSDSKGIRHSITLLLEEYSKFIAQRSNKDLC